ncbi:MAG: hypothetical protein K2O05_01425, partial [Anaeroplasmataceae bacterium]|nr:hypothetical protein [Anaeroplasmataceae bacterium]
IEVSMITNGFYLSNEFIKENQNKLSMIGLSIDSLNYDTNIRMGRCEREKTLTKAEIINKCLLIKNIGIKLKINICITSNNKDEDFDDFFKKVNPDRIKILRVLCNHNETLKSISISDDEWQIVQETFKKYTKIFEDNDYMKSNYIIIDSKGNMTKNNLHVENNSIFHKSVSNCLEHLNSVKEV